MKFQNLTGDKTWDYSPKLKLWQNSNCDKTQIVTKLKMGRKKKLKKLKCEEEETKTIKMWQNSNCDKTKELNLW